MRGGGLRQLPSIGRKEEWGQIGCPVDPVIEAGTFRGEDDGTASWKRNMKDNRCPDVWGGENRGLIVG